MADLRISEFPFATSFFGSKLIPAVNSSGVSAEKWTVGLMGGLTHSSATAALTMGSSHRATLSAFLTSATVECTLPSTSLAGLGWWCVVRNDSSNTVTLACTTTRTLDASTAVTLQQNVERLIYYKSTDGFGSLGLHSRIVDTQIFTANGTWNKHPWAKTCVVDVIGAGAGGGGGGSAGVGGCGGSGGGGGGRNIEWIPASALSSSYTVTVGSGGAGGGSSLDGVNGGNSDFGSLVFAYGGGAGFKGLGGAVQCGGAGGGIMTAGSSGSTLTSTGGAPSNSTNTFHNSGWGGAGTQSSTHGKPGAFGGGAGGGGGNSTTLSGAGGCSAYGGGGGGAGGFASGAAHSSGGAGGDNDVGLNGGGGAGGAAGSSVAATAGSSGSYIHSGQGGGGGGGNLGGGIGGPGGAGGIPGGGGGGGGYGGTGSSGGAGARGEVRVWSFG